MEKVLGVDEVQKKNLPELTGTEKQVAWATEIRSRLIREYILENESNEDFKDEELDPVVITQYICENHTSSRDWIDWSRNDGMDLAHKKWTREYERYRRRLWEESQKSEEERAAEAAALAEEEAERKAAEERAERSRAERTAKSSDDPKPGVVVIKYAPNGTTIDLVYEKDEDFIEIAKRNGFVWASFWKVWCKAIDEYTGSTEDRMASIGHDLLDEGFVVEFPSVEIKEKAVNANYEREHRSWIRADGDKIEIWFARFKGKWNLYGNAISIKSAKYIKGESRILVKPEFYKEVLEFAQEYDIPLTEDAKALIQKQIAKEQQIPVTEIAEYVKKSGLPALQIVMDEAGVIADLRDDD